MRDVEVNSALSSDEKAQRRTVWGNSSELTAPGCSFIFFLFFSPVGPEGEREGGNGGVRNLERMNFSRLTFCAVKTHRAMG